MSDWIEAQTKLSCTPDYSTKLGILEILTYFKLFAMNKSNANQFNF